MGFDLYFDKFHHTVEHHQEWVLDLATDPQRFPKLCWLRSQWYYDPKLEPSECNDLVHELIELQQQTGDRSGKHALEKLMLFFSRAYRSDTTVECYSD
ncbi:MAG: hypothetical protein AAF685_09555 [Cyanobacteria bacterium P01_C01_bin.89]